MLLLPLDCGACPFLGVSLAADAVGGSVFLKKTSPLALVLAGVVAIPSCLSKEDSNRLSSGFDFV